LINGVRDYDLDVFKLLTLKLLCGLNSCRAQLLLVNLRNLDKQASFGGLRVIEPVSAGHIEVLSEFFRLRKLRNQTLNVFGALLDLLLGQNNSHGSVSL
jgi:hypothetical protein